MAAHQNRSRSDTDLCHDRFLMRPLSSHAKNPEEIGWRRPLPGLHLNERSHAAAVKSFLVPTNHLGTTRKAHGVGLSVLASLVAESWNQITVWLGEFA